MERVFKFFPSSDGIRATAKCFSSRNKLAWRAAGICLILRLGSPGFSLFAQTAVVPNDEASESAKTNVITLAQPTNVEPTTLLGKQEVSLAIFRFHPRATQQAETSLRSTFAKNREIFLAAVQRASRRRLLDEKTVAHPSFRTFVSWFQNEHSAFPLSDHLARLWALGESDEPIQSEWTSRLRTMMVNYIRADGPIEPLESESGHVLMIAVTRTNAVIDVETVEHWATPVAKTNLYTLSKMRKDSLNGLSAEQRDIVRFLAGFLKENCFFDEALTSQLKMAAEVALTPSSPPDHGIAGNGQSVGGESNAVNLLSASTEPESERTPGVFEQLERARAWGESLMKQLGRISLRVQSAGWKTSAALAGLALLCLILLWRIHRRKRSPLPPATRVVGAELSYTVILNRDRNETIFLPAKATQNPAVVPLTALEPVTPVEMPAIADQKAWQDRVLAAEKRAEELMTLVREGLAPHLARELMNKLVRELIWQRAGLLHTHQVAERELSGMEARFEHVISQLQERLAAYEKRNAELERELAAQREENIELIKAGIFMTQNKLEAEQANQRQVKA